MGTASVTGTRTIVFTDLVGSTAMRSRIGDVAADDLRREHDRTLRQVVELHGGAVAKGLGDGIMAVFGSAVDAARSAVEMQQQIALLGARLRAELSIRVGMSAGDVLVEEGDWFGTPVVEAARLGAVAEGGQILASDLVRLLAGSRSDVQFETVGSLELKGLPVPVAACELQWDPLPPEPEPVPGGFDRAGGVPVVRSSFVGRHRELADLRAMVGEGRLVTLTGSGGVGKTRLALQIMNDRADADADEMRFVDLALLDHGDRVALAVARALGVREDPDRPVLETLVDAVGDRAALVVLDNCEHVIDHTAKLADALLRWCPRMALVATSREPLGIDGEIIYRVPSLGLPDDANGEDASESSELFVERVRQHTSGFTPDAQAAAGISRVCRRLDGIPLAIELAAARLASLSLDDLETRLDQRFRLLVGGTRTSLPRQQTLQALIDWSYDLLTAPEQELLARLSVFVGGWDLGATEALFADEDGWMVIDHVRSLVDKNLVQADHGGAGAVRYRLLETIREYAATKLVAKGLDVVTSVRDAHRDHYLGMAESAADHLVGHDQLTWLARLEIDHDNLLAALDHCLTDPDPDPGLRLAAALRWYWTYRDHAFTTVDHVSDIVDREAAREATSVRGRALLALGHLRVETWNASSAVPPLREALDIGRAHGDESIVADALRYLAVAESRAPVADRARLADESLGIARRLDDPHLIAQALSARAICTMDDGDTEAQLSCLGEAHALWADAGNRFQESVALCNIGSTRMLHGDYEAAHSALTEAYLIDHDLGATLNLLFSTFNLGLVESILGNDPRACAMFGESLALAHRLGDLASFAYALLGIAQRDAGDPGRSVRLLGAADRGLEQRGEKLEVLEARIREAAVARLRSQLGDGFDAAYKQGWGLPRDEVIELANQEIRAATA